jgi:NitT/TauT family transport system substrate-binding protein
MRVLVACLAAALAVVSAACVANPALVPVAPVKDKLKLPTVLAYESTLPSLVAVAHDYFGEENIEIEDFVLGSSSTLRSAVISGEYDFGLFAFVHVPIARQANSPWKMIVANHDHEVFSLVVRSGLRGAVASVGDLRGKRVGFSTAGSGSWALASAYLRKAGLDPERDVEFIALGADANVIYTALETGKVDAMVSWEPTTSRALASGVAFPLISIWQPEDHRAWLGGDVALSEGLVTREDVIRNKPDLVRRMVNAQRKGLAFIRGHSSAEIADVVLANSLAKQQFEGLDRGLIESILERIKPGFGTGCLSRTGFQVEMDLAVQYQVVRTPISFEDFSETTWAGACTAAPGQPEASAAPGQLGATAAPGTPAAVASGGSAAPGRAAAVARQAAEATAVKPAAAAGECSVLDAAAIEKVTGTPVRGVAGGSFAGAGGTCANYTTGDGKPYLGVNALNSPAEYASTVAAVPALVYEAKTPLRGLGDEAVLFTDRADRPSIRYLVARKGDHGVVLFPLSGAQDLADAKLRELAEVALR